MLSSDPPGTPPESDGTQRRGRARSGAFHTGDPILADLDAVLGEETPAVAEPPSPDSASAGSSEGVGSSSGASTGSGSSSDSGEDDTDDVMPRRKGGTVSKKTARILTTLEPQPPRSFPHTGDEVLTESELAEAEAATAEPPTRRPKPRRKDPQEYDVCIKLLLLGDAGVGKTSLLMKYAEEKFSTSLLSTAGVDYKTKFLKVSGKVVKCQIWDTAGQQRFHVITQTYYRGAHGIILVYDASDPTEESFQNVSYWMENIRTHASPTTQKILLGNKIDVPGPKISTARGQAVATQHDIRFLETSAKEGTNVSKAFHTIARDIIQRQSLGGAVKPAPKGDTAKPARDKKGGKCTVM